MLISLSARSLLRALSFKTVDFSLFFTGIVGIYWFAAGLGCFGRGLAMFDGRGGVLVSI